MALSSIILFADREPNGLPSFSNHLGDKLDFPVKNVLTNRDLKTYFQEYMVEMLVIDLNFMKLQDPLLFFSTLKKDHPDTLILPVIPEKHNDIIEKISELEISHFIHKPLDPEETTQVLQRAYSTITGRKNNTGRRSEQTTSFRGMIGSCQVMRDLFQLIKLVAEDDISTVLIRGNSGTGKEMVAKAIHAESRRCDKNFVPVNCAAIPDDLLESELFGYTKGAFTGATTNKPGRIQYADGGTLFLDEIGDMKASLQAKLLRVLQEKEFEPVGAFKAIPVDTRILAATHCDLEQLVREGKFREDLYYRLSVIPLNIPPLKDRVADIPLLIKAFIRNYSEKRGREKFSFAPGAMTALQQFEWPGNVRELENLIQHMAILFSGREVGYGDLPDKFHSEDLTDGNKLPPAPPQNKEDGEEAIPKNHIMWKDGQIDFNEVINDFETQLIVQAMKLTRGNKKEAAQLLNLKRTTLLEKIKKKNIEGPWDS